MSNFVRALQFAWPYRFRFAISVVCALMVALFWGANLTAVYPVLKIFFRDQNLQQWIDQVVAGQEATVSELQGPGGQGSAGLGRRRSSSVGAGVASRGDTGHAGGRATAMTLARARWKLRCYRHAQALIHRFLPEDRRQTLVYIMLLLILGLGCKGLFHYCHEWLVGSVTHLSMFDLKNRLYRHTINADLAMFNQQGSSDLMARFTNDMETLGSGMNTLLGKMVREPLKAVACIVLACWLNWRLTLVVLGLFPLAVLLMSSIGRQMRRATRRYLENMASIYRLLQESFQGIKIVKAFAMERYEKRRFYTATKNYYRKAMRIVKLEALTSPAMEMIGMGAIVVALLIGTFLVIGNTDRIWGIKMADGPMDQETLALLYAFLAGVSDPARKLSNVYGRMMRASAAADRIFAFLDRPASITDRPGARPLRRHHECIEFRDVSFSYPGSPPVLQDINLKVRFGETIGIIGPNGCGKTTLVSLIPRFYDVQRGCVRIDDVDVRDAQTRSIRQQIGFVTQEVTLFNDTVWNNIGYGDRQASRDQIQDAARKAYAHQFISTLPDGYDTSLGERAVKLSGGERQRIALARAILRDPAILILDEATSALDVESESLIHRALERFIVGRTAFIITHRLSILELADRIVVMDAGRIVDVGRHAELMRRCALYRRLRDIHSAAAMRLSA